MIQPSNNQHKKLFEFNSVISYVSKIFPTYVTTAILLGIITKAYSTIISKDYWTFIGANIVNICYDFFSLIAHSQDYFIANSAIIFGLIMMVNYFKPQSWIEKTKYSQKEHSSFYVSQLMKQGAKISNKDELIIFMSRYC